MYIWKNLLDKFFSTFLIIFLKLINIETMDGRKWGKYKVDPGYSTFWPFLGAVLGFGPLFHRL